MTVRETGEGQRQMTDGPLFIVDNRASGRNGLDYLREWSELASGIDIATGFFEIGALLDLDGHWQKFDTLRVLMGDDISRRSRKALLMAVRQRAEERLDESIENDKEGEPFLTGVAAIVAALKSGQIQCRVYDRDKFHKAYITHARFEVIGSQALVGSSNFTRPGLSMTLDDPEHIGGTASQGCWSTPVSGIPGWLRSAPAAACRVGG